MRSNRRRALRPTSRCPSRRVTSVARSSRSRLIATGAAGIGFTLQISIWLWFTVLFANFAEAMAEARGKAQADTLRKTKTDALAKRIAGSGTIEQVTSSALRAATKSNNDRRTPTLTCQAVVTI